MKKQRKLSREYLNDIERIGYISAQFPAIFCKWVENERSFDVKGAMRGAEWLIYMAQLMGYDWKPLFINTDIMYHINDKIIEEYMEQEKANKSFTLIDNGYRGSLAKRIKNKHKFNARKLETFLLTGTESFAVTKNVNTLFSSMEPLLGFSNADYFVSFQEFIPRKHKDYDIDNFERKNECVSVNLEDNNNRMMQQHKTFFSGLKNGYKDCANAVECNDKEQITRYAITLADGGHWDIKKLLKFGEERFDIKKYKALYDDRQSILEKFEKIRNIYKTGQEK